MERVSTCSTRRKRYLSPLSLRSFRVSRPRHFRRYRRSSWFRGVARAHIRAAPAVVGILQTVSARPGEHGRWRNYAHGGAESGRRYPCGQGRRRFFAGRDCVELLFDAGALSAAADPRFLLAGNGNVPAELDGEALPRNRARIVLAGDDAPHTSGIAPDDQLSRRAPHHHGTLGASDIEGRTRWLTR